MSESIYGQLGVDARKGAVRKAFGGVVKNSCPGAFVNIAFDTRRGTAFTQHMDGDGSKFIQRLLNYREGAEAEVFQGAVDDALSMNLGDIAAAGFVEARILVTDVLNINSRYAPKETIMEQIARRFEELLRIYEAHGFDIYFMGGETADLPDQLRSVAFDIAVSAETAAENIIRGNIAPGDKIWGFASDGKAAWEQELNSGIMSNGLTMARNFLMSSGYNQYPELGGRYRGKYEVGEVHERLPMDLSMALISPTRQWAILIKLLLDTFKEEGILDCVHGISMNTGGGATKVSNLGTGGILFEKRMPDPPPLFKIIQEASGEEWRNMFTTFNCGVGIDVVVADNPRVEEIVRKVSRETQVACFELGRCLALSEPSAPNKIRLETPFGSFDY